MGKRRREAFKIYEDPATKKIGMALSNKQFYI